MNVSRRSFLTGLASLPFLPQYLMANSEQKKRPIERLIFVYHPDGAFLDQWHLAQGAGAIRDLSKSLSGLQKFRDQMILLRRINILDGKGDGHIEPASYLLAGAKTQNYGTIDVQLAEYFEKPLIHLGVQASKYNGESISYLPGGSQKIADDSPISTHQRLLGDPGTKNLPDDAVLDLVEKELQELVKGLPEKEQIKLGQHLSQMKTLGRQVGACQTQGVDLSGYQEDLKHQDKAVPMIMDLQMEILVQALYCGVSPVASFQLSRNTSPMKMDFDWLDRWQDRWPMESHQASHNDAEIHAQQKRWINTQLAKLLGRLAALPEPNPQKSGSMLDHSLVVVLTEISNGAAHGRADMPFYIVGGRGSGLLKNGEVVDCGDASHSQLLYSLAGLLGMPAREPYFRSGPLPQIFKV
ncbi:MAG: DUF1552 domain-containing protein [Oligoflexus sp.]